MKMDEITKTSSLEGNLALPFEINLDSILNEYKSSILKAFIFDKKGNEKTEKRNNYELEMFSRLAYDYEQLEELEQQEFKIAIKELLKMS